MKTSKKTREPQQSRSISTKEKIINSGVALFSKKGYHNTNSKEIARHAGVGVGSFYDYFTDKKQLLMMILVRHRSEVAQSLEKMQAGLAFDSTKKLTKEAKLSILTGFINYVMDFHDNGSEFHSQIPRLRHLDPEIEEINNKWDEYEIKVIYNILKKPELGIKLDDYKTASILIHRATEDTAHYLMACNDEVKKAKIKKELIDMLGKYLFD